MTALLRRFRDFYRSAVPGEDMFLVGGAVRDLLLDLETRDIDVAVQGDALGIARAFANDIGATYVALDKDFGIARVVQGDEYIDVCALRGANIHDDLADRDFTINAMALRINSGEGAAPGDLKSDVIDPFGGAKDSRYRTIRMVSEQNLINDPLRILRAYRFTATHRFLIEINTLNALRRNAHLLSAVAVERISDELHHLLESSHAYATIEAMNKDGVLDFVFPELLTVEPDTKLRLLQSFRYAEHIMDNLALYFPEYLEQFGAYCRKGLHLLAIKLCALLCNDIKAHEVTERLRFGNKTAELVRFLGMDINVVAAAHDENARIALLQDYGDHIHGLIILALAQQRTCQKGEEPLLDYCKEIVAFFHGVYSARKHLLPLITGDDLIKQFGLSPSPKFRQILRSIEMKVLTGGLATREEALDVVKRMLI